MELKTYFENTKGFGVLSTSDGDGNVNAAVYSRPHVMEDGSLAFIMRDRLTHANIRKNPKAVFLFREEGNGYQGKRLYLTRIREEKDTDLLYELRRRTYPPDKDPDDPRFLVWFQLDQELPLIGAGSD